MLKTLIYDYFLPAIMILLILSMSALPYFVQGEWTCYPVHLRLCNCSHFLSARQLVLVWSRTHKVSDILFMVLLYQHQQSYSLSSPFIVIIIFCLWNMIAELKELYKWISWVSQIGCELDFSPLRNFLAHAIKLYAAA